MRKCFQQCFRENKWNSVWLRIRWKTKSKSSRPRKKKQQQQQQAVPTPSGVNSLNRGKQLNNMKNRRPNLGPQTHRIWPWSESVNNSKFKSLCFGRWEWKSMENARKKRPRSTYVGRGAVERKPKSYTGGEWSCNPTWYSISCHSDHARMCASQHRHDRYSAPSSSS